MSKCQTLILMSNVGNNCLLCIFTHVIVLLKLSSKRKSVVIYSKGNFFRFISDIRNPIIPHTMIFVVLLLVGFIILNTANGYVGNNALFASLAQIEIVWQNEIKLIKLLERILEGSKTKDQYLMK